MMNNSILKSILLKRKDISDSELLVHDFSEKTEAAEFYHKQFYSDNSEYNSIKINRELLQSKTMEGVPAESKIIVDLIRNHINEDSIIIEIGGSVHQRRSGFATHHFNNYFPLDISYSSMKRYSEKYNKEAIVCNASSLPFINESVDVIFTHHFMEHVSKPDQVVDEIARVLKKGGMVIHCDAWNCRWWQKYAFKVRKISDLSYREFVLYLISLITETPIFRMPLIVLKRLLFLYIFRNKNKFYSSLDPNYNLHLYVDEDAASSIDPVMLRKYYLHKGFDCYFPVRFIDKLFFRKPYIVLYKH